MSLNKVLVTCAGITALGTSFLAASAQAAPSTFGMDPLSFQRAGGFAFGAVGAGLTVEAGGTTPGVTFNGFDSFIIDAPVVTDGDFAFTTFGGFGLDLLRPDGQSFDPADYQIEVDFKLLANNEEDQFNVELSQSDGFVGADQRGESFQFAFTNLADFVANNTPDADGFYTFTRSISENPNMSGIPWDFRQQAFGLPLDGDMDIDFAAVDGGINGIFQIQVQTVFGSENRFNMEFRNVRIAPMVALEEVARLDSSAFTLTFDSFDQPGALTRDDGSALTNLIVDAQDQGGDGGAFGGVGVRPTVDQAQFNGEEHSIEVVAKVLSNNAATSFNVLANDVDGDDSGPGLGGEQWIVNFPIDQFNSTTFTTVTIPLNQATLDSPAFDFSNAGDGLLTDFDLFELQLQSNEGDTERLNIEVQSVRVIQSPDILGDYDGDGDADGNDYLLWQRTFGDAVTPGSGADGNGNGMIDSVDLDIWETNYGQTNVAPIGGALGTVPEPSSCFLVLAGLVSLSMLKRAN